MFRAKTGETSEENAAPSGEITLEICILYRFLIALVRFQAWKSSKKQNFTQQLQG